MALSTIPLVQGSFGWLFQAIEVYTKDILTTVLTLTLIAGASLAVGYTLGSLTRRPIAVAPEDDDVDDPVEEVSDGDLSAITPGFMEPCKMVRQFFSSS